MTVHQATCICPNVPKPISSYFSQIIQIVDLHSVTSVRKKPEREDAVKMGLVADGKPFHISINHHIIRRRNRMLSGVQSMKIENISITVF